MTYIVFIRLMTDLAFIPLMAVTQDSGSPLPRILHP